jgi:hypothetical protein
MPHRAIGGRQDCGYRRQAILLTTADVEQEDEPAPICPVSVNDIDRNNE